MSLSLSQHLFGTETPKIISHQLVLLFVFRVVGDRSVRMWLWCSRRCRATIALSRYFFGRVAIALPCCICFTCHAKKRIFDRNNFQTGKTMKKKKNVFFRTQKQIATTLSFLENEKQKEEKAEKADKKRNREFSIIFVAAGVTMSGKFLLSSRQGVTFTSHRIRVKMFLFFHFFFFFLSISNVFQIKCFFIFFLTTFHFISFQLFSLAK